MAHPRRQRTQADGREVAVLRWVSVVLIVALASLLLMAGFVAVLRSHSSGGPGMTLAGVTTALMALITLVVRLARADAAPPQARSRATRRGRRRRSPRNRSAAAL